MRPTDQPTKQVGITIINDSITKTNTITRINTNSKPLMYLLLLMLNDSKHLFYMCVFIDIYF